MKMLYVTSSIQGFVLHLHPLEKSGKSPSETLMNNSHRYSQNKNKYIRLKKESQQIVKWSMHEHAERYRERSFKVFFLFSPGNSEYVSHI